MTYILIGFELVIGGILGWCFFAACIGVAGWLCLKIEEHHELIVPCLKRAGVLMIVLGAIAGFLVAYPDGLPLVAIAIVAWGFALSLFSWSKI